ncbi:MAG: AAA family ATPase [Bacteriovoracaceae bacterium]|nr:AAA family ATPase [Bacteriovoracaceae bacterium]
MLLERIIIEGFRSCRDTEQISLANLTTLVGGNSADKTSFLLALDRMFGVTQKDRTITSEDFYIGPNESLNDVEERSLFIEAKIIFPELIHGIDKNMSAVAESFRHMIVDATKSNTPVPYCRMRLEAKYTRDPFGDGDIQTKLLWVRDSYCTNYEIDFFTQQDTAEVSATERQRIRVVYVPAGEDPSPKLQQFSENLLEPFIRSVNWGNNPETILSGSLQSANEVLDIEEGVQVLNDHVASVWNQLSPSFKDTFPKLSFIDESIKKLLKSMMVKFDHGEQQKNTTIYDLDHDEQTLFHITLMESALTLRDLFLSDAKIKVGSTRREFSSVFDHEQITLPGLTMLVIEGPENQISPYHYGHLIEALKSISNRDGSQVLFSTHSPEVITRVEPEDLRYFGPQENKTLYSELILPALDHAAYVYVRAAVAAHPELYLAKAVVLCEGESEQIILKKLFEAKGMALNQSMIAVIPLGGHHVHHFWKLLKNLGVPFVTLLDLDLGKEGGGWKKIQYAINQLIDYGFSRSDVYGEGEHALTAKQLEEMHKWTVGRDFTSINSWIGFLEDYHIFYNRNLDLDFMMLDKFFDKYMYAVKSSLGTPKPVPSSTNRYFEQKILTIKSAIFGDNAQMINNYDLEKLNLYKFLFTNKAKALTHKLVTASLSNDEFMQGCPEVLNHLADRISSMIDDTNDTDEIDDIDDTSLDEAYDSTTSDYDEDLL